MRFIDFDGVIMESETLLFEEWCKRPNYKELSEEEKVKYIINQNWKYILENSSDINDSLYILKNMDPNDNMILTRVHSLDNEGKEKILFLRNKGIKVPVVLAPYPLKKNEIVCAKNNILVDDSLKNLEEWEKDGGYPLFFDKKENNIDSWGLYNKKGYQRVLRIDEKLK